jgi:transposase
VASAPGRRRVALKNRIHATLLAFGKPCVVSDLFGFGGRQLLARLDVPEPWAGNLAAAVELIDVLDGQVAECERELRRLGADHAYVPTLMTTPGVAWVLGYTIASEIGDISRFASPKKLVAYTGLCPRVYQSGNADHRGPLAKNGPKYLRWAYIEAATHAARHAAYRNRYQRMKARLGRQRGSKVARVDIAVASRTRTGTCSPRGNRSLRQVPRTRLWSPDDPGLRWTTGEFSHPT